MTNPYPLFQSLLRTHQIARQFKQGNWEPETLAAALQNKNTHNSIRNKTLWLSVLRNTSAAAPQLIEEISSWPVNFEAVRNARLNALIASTLLDNNQQTEAASIANNMLSKQSSELMRNPHLLNLVDLRKELPSEQTDTIKRAKQLMASIKPLDDWFTERDISTISVVGNAPVQVGSSAGHKIDTADCVVRFNRTVLNTERQNDYGKKTNLWVVSPAFPLSSMQKMPTSTIAVSGHQPFHRSSKYWHSLSKMENSEFLYFSRRNWLSLVDQLKAPPSSGLLCLYSLINAKTRHKVEAFGFTQHYQADLQNHGTDSDKRSTRHNWGQEARMVTQLIGELD